MGCLNSKHAVRNASTPPRQMPGLVIQENELAIAVSSSKVSSSSGFAEPPEEKQENKDNIDKVSELGAKSVKSHRPNVKFSMSFKLGSHHVNVEAEQTAAGWPSWLSAVAGEAIHGWLPMKAESFEKMEKIGQGTYSSVFRAREMESGRIVALKKVRFDNFQQESIRFMAREIAFLRRLDHPNVMKLEGIITSRLSCSIYLVFEYMDHDLAGLVSAPDIKFSDAQIKCYLQQLLYGLEHCHIHGVMHRDIKTSNILLNNKGLLKLADFGLANIYNSRSKQPLTSRVVTLWYRPPELLMGSTNYGVSVDLWSVGCVFAEILTGKPILKGRTEVEQLHKIFKICGSLPDEFWKTTKLPRATMFKSQQPYESSLREKCKEFPTTALELLETFLALEPGKRGTASSALNSEYFRTKPFACDPSSLPQYPPNKEIDAKAREEAKRKRTGVRPHINGAQRRPRRVPRAFQETNELSRFAPREESCSQSAQKNKSPAHRGKGLVPQLPLKSSFDTISDLSQMTTASQGDILISGHHGVAPSSSYTWAKRRNMDSVHMKSSQRRSARTALSALDDDARSVLDGKTSWDPSDQEYDSSSNSSGGGDSYRNVRQEFIKQQRELNLPDSVDASDTFDNHPSLVTAKVQHPSETIQKTRTKKYMVEFSGSLQPNELRRRQEGQLCQPIRKSRGVTEMACNLARPPIGFLGVIDKFHSKVLRQVKIYDSDLLTCPNGQ